MDGKKCHRKTPNYSKPARFLTAPKPSFESFFNEIERETSLKPNFLKSKLNCIYRVEYWNSDSYLEMDTLRCPECGR